MTHDVIVERYIYLGLLKIWASVIYKIWCINDSSQVGLNNKDGELHFVNIRIVLKIQVVSLMIHSMPV